MSAAIQISAQRITKRYLGASVLDALDFILEQGEFVLLLGANGAGKSTLLRILSSLLRFDSGELEYADQTVRPTSSIGFLGHALQLYDQLSVSENLRFFAKLRGIKLDLDAVLRSWQLDQVADKQLALLSRGMKQRSALAATLLHQPNILLLDEPSTALDAAGCEILRQLLTTQHRTKSVLIATHDLNTWSDCANRVVLLEHGKIKLDTKELKKLYPSEALNALKEKVIGQYREANR